MTYTYQRAVARFPLVRTSTLALVMLLGACKADVGPFYAQVDAASGFRVTGSVAGLWAPAGVSLRLEAEDVEQVLNVDQDGTFEFEPYLDDGTPFVVSIASQPDQHDCVLADGIGTIEESDAEVAVRCTGPIDVDIDWTAHQSLGFDPLQATTLVDVSVLLREVQLVVAAPGATLVELNDAALASGESSSPITIPFGDSTWTVRIVAGDFSRTFTFQVTRGFEKPAQSLYAKASNTDEWDKFGLSIAASGDVVVVGAPREDSGSLSNGDQSDNGLEAAGAVYVFRYVDEEWSQEAYLKASNPGLGDGFGGAVALDGDLLVVGADGEASASPGIDGDETDDTLTGAGAVYVFRRSGAEWLQEAYLKASNPGERDNFGRSVAVSGNRIVVGATGESSDSNTVNSGEADDSAAAAGAAYIFEKTTVWQQVAYLKASNSDAEDFFGWSVDIEADRVIVGAPYERSNGEGPNGDQSDNSLQEAGAAYVFKPTETGWVQEVYLKPLGTSDHMRFGTSAAMSASLAVVGAPHEGMGSDWWIGGAYVFRRAGSYWSVEAELRASNAEPSDFFGDGVAIAGDTIVVGAIGEASRSSGADGDQSNNKCPWTGAAYVYGYSGEWRQLHYLKQGAPSACSDDGTHFGSRVAMTDQSLVVAAPGDDSAATGLNGDSQNGDAQASGGIYVLQ
jgi:hypothetical protein